MYRTWRQESNTIDELLVDEGVSHSPHSTHSSSSLPTVEEQASVAVESMALYQEQQQQQQQQQQHQHQPGMGRGGGTSMMLVSGYSGGPTFCDHSFSSPAVATDDDLCSLWE